jgi:predicted AlkP superfamily phosphohydrolase/phosphomutase
MRVVVFGVDGLTFRVLHPLMERGELPNFQRLSRDGCEAVLESKYPPLTPPAWLSLATGLKPAGHGIYDFWEYEEHPESASARRATVQTRRKGGKAIWNILSEYGKKVLVINVPMTYPPEAVNGIMVSGYMTPSPDVDFTYPVAFKEELFRVIPDYEIDLAPQDKAIVGWSGRMARLIDATLRMTERRIQLIHYMLKEKSWDFCFLGFVGADRIQHRLWDEIMSLDTRATEYFKLLDHGLGLVLDLLGPDDCLFVVSDHGFQGVNRCFDINQYLFSKNLVTRGASSSPSRKHGEGLRILKQTLKQAGLLPLTRRIKSGLIGTGLLQDTAIDFHQPISRNIDWQRTLAYVPSSSGFGSGYADIFLGADLEAERLSELCEDLKAQVDPLTGKALIDAIYSTEVYGKGPYAPREQHLLLLPTDGITFRMGFGNDKFWDDATMANDSGKRSGVHQQDGVLFAFGATTKHGFKASNAEVYDLVPTVLRAMGLPVPDSLDGRVLDELFVESQQREPPIAAAAKSSVVQRKLQKLLD